MLEQGVIGPSQAWFVTEIKRLTKSLAHADWQYSNMLGKYERMEERAARCVQNKEGAGGE